MKSIYRLGLAGALCLSALVLRAEDSSEVERLRAELRQMQENFEKSRQQQQQQLDALAKKLEALTAPHGAQASTDDQKAAERQQLEQQLAADWAAATPRGNPASETATSAPASAPESAGGGSARAGSAYMNISFG